MWVEASIATLSIADSRQFRAHTQAYRALGLLERYGYQLHALLTLEQGLDTSTLPSALPVYPINAAAYAWKTYILHESARRTLLIIFFMQSLCHALRGQIGYCREREALNCYLLGSSHLWKAGSAFDFAKAWNDRDRLVVEDVDFSPLLLHAEPDDLDTFGRMLLVAKLGIDEVRGWFDFKGGRFDG